MAKENKSLGYLVLAIIPLIGLTWAAIEGSRHNKYVKETLSIEESFENDFFVSLNEYLQENGKDSLTEKLDITSIIPVRYDHLYNDPINQGDSSYTISIGTNPTTKLNDKGETEVDTFKVVYEFFVPSVVYEDFSEYFDMDYISTLGYKSNTYETYYLHNPRKSPITQIGNIFDKYKSNIYNLEIDGNVLVGYSASVFNNQLDSLGLVDDIKASDRSKLTSIKQIYEALSNEEKENADKEKYDLYDMVCSVRELEEDIDSLPDISKEDLTLDKISIEDVYKDYNKLSSEQKEYLHSEKEDKLLTLYIKVQAQVVINLIYSAKTTYLTKEINASAYSTIKGIVKNYNSLSNDSKLLITLSDYNELASLVTRANNWVTTYNADPSTKTQKQLIVLEEYQGE